MKNTLNSGLLIGLETPLFISGDDSYSNIWRVQSKCNDGFPTFSDDDIKDILAYIENPPVEEVAIVEEESKEIIETKSI